MSETTFRFAAPGSRIEHPPRFWRIKHPRYEVRQRDEHFLIFEDTRTGDVLSITFTDDPNAPKHMVL